MQAIYLSRSREALRDAWEVFLAATGSRENETKASSVKRARIASDRGGAMNLAQFGRLLPLLGDDLPLSRVERLFEEVDVDRSGEIDFDEVGARRAAERFLVLSALPPTPHPASLRRGACMDSRGLVCVSDVLDARLPP